MIAAEPIELLFGYSTEPVVVRVCVDCREPKEIGEFRAVKGSPLPYCRPCEHERRRRYREENTEKVREQRRRYYEENAEKERERTRRYHGENAEKVRERKRRYHEENAEKERERRRRYREEHPEEERERERYRRKENAARTPAQIEADRRELHPDGTKVCRSCREALPFEAFVADRMTRSGLSKDCRACKAAKQRARLERHVAVLFGEDRSAWECYVCGGPYEEIEHLWPLSLFGEDRPSNILPACVSCNRGTGGKHDRDPRAWLLDRLGPDDAWAILAERLPSSLLVSA